MPAIYPIGTGRISDVLLQKRVMSQFAYNRSELVRLQDQLASGYRITTPSQDAPAAARAIALQRLLEQKDQAKVNLTTSQSYLNMTENALADTSDLLIRMKGQALTAVDSTTSPEQRAGLIAPRAGWYPGRPVMVVRNDYNLHLYNGDIGIAVDDPQRPGRLQVCFLSADGALRRLAPARLPPHETVYAMTVHKSQGSEFDRVLLVLPDEDNPLLTRELVYTGITRARAGFRLRAPAALLAQAVGRRLARVSGLRHALWGASA